MSRQFLFNNFSYQQGQRGPIVLGKKIDTDDKKTSIAKCMFSDTYSSRDNKALAMDLGSLELSAANTIKNVMEELDNVNDSAVLGKCINRKN